MTTYIPEHLKRWTRPDCYIGAEWPGYYHSPCGQHRDSDALYRSNFQTMLKLLGGESETVRVIHEGHWAVGWVEWIAIHESDEKALRIADEAAKDLEDYPVLDEMHWSELEMEDANETWKNCFNPMERIKYIRENRSQFDFHDFKDLIGCVRGEYFAGYASDLLN
jgi:hypothetical protein